MNIFEKIFSAELWKKNWESACERADRWKADSLHWERMYREQKGLAEHWEQLYRRAIFRLSHAPDIGNKERTEEKEGQ